MRAVVIRAFGGPEQLELADMPKPVPGRGQVLVKVKAASVNPVDFKIRQSGQWAQVPMPAILGYDAAGVVEAVGDLVTNLKVGDEVFYCARIFGRQGTYAEYHVEDAEIVHRKPAILTFEEAASLPLAAITAWDTVATFFHTKPTDTVLIHAGAGGVGNFAVQLARAAGARVLATGRKENQGLIVSEPMRSSTTGRRGSKTRCSGSPRAPGSTRPSTPSGATPSRGASRWYGPTGSSRRW